LASKTTASTQATTFFTADSVPQRRTLPGRTRKWRAQPARGCRRRVASSTRIPLGGGPDAALPAQILSCPPWRWAALAPPSHIERMLVRRPLPPAPLPLPSSDVFLRRAIVLSSQNRLAAY